MKINISSDRFEMTKAAARLAADHIRSHPGRLLCFAAGDTPLPMYAELARMHKAGEVDLASMWYVGLDEWLGLGYEDKGSCRQVMYDNFYNTAGIPGERILAFDGKTPDPVGYCRRVDGWIAEKGGISLTVLGIGMNGHLGFNEPGVDISERCIMLDLSGTTLNVGKKYFNGGEAPAKGVTVGLGQLLKAETVILEAEGDRKADIVRAALEGKVTVNNPASLLTTHGNCFCFLDRAAASKLSSQKDLPL